VYRERAARTSPGAVVWSRERTTDAVADVRVLPDGCMDLIWTDGALLVAGPDTTAKVVSGRAGDSYVGLRFASGTGPGVLGVPAVEVRDLRVPLEAVWPARPARELAERIGEATDRAAALEAVATARPSQPDRIAHGVLRGLRGGMSVGALARELAVSERQLRRRCLDAFGYGPKTLDRVLRLERALDLARTDAPFAQVALVAGYADQAHLAREVRALTGVPLGRLLADERADASAAG
jgi:AraC-like DNA-binding protein